MTTLISRFAVILYLCCLPAQAAEWKATEINGELAKALSKPTYRMSDEAVEAAGIVFENGKPALNPNAKAVVNGWSMYSKTIIPMQNGLPDGDVDIYAEVMLPTSAWYTKPTKRYPHGALGDDIEAGALIVQMGQLETGRFVHTLPSHQVFEDRVPRVLTLEGFGVASVVTILSDKNKGASVALFGPSEPSKKFGGEFKLLSQTPYIGTPNRWLNIAGIEDFDGSGSQSIAVVETPHIGGTLQFWRWSRGKLTKIAEKSGFSNHKYQSREQRLSAVEDFDNDGVSDLALPSNDRRSLKLVKLSDFKKPQVLEIASIDFRAPIDKAIAVSRIGADVTLTLGLEDGSVWAVHQ